MSTVLTSAKNNGISDTQEERKVELFNEEIKERFLDDSVNRGVISQKTSESYRNIFKRTYKLKEKKAKKDLYEFDMKEMESLLIKFEANNRNTIESYGRIISSYLNWCVDNSLTDTNIIADLKPDDFIKYLLNEEKYFTYKQLLYYEEGCKNSQDSVLLRLIFNGFIGKNLSEIRNLKMTDLDKERKMIRLVNNLKEDPDSGMPIEFTERWEHLDDYTMELIEDAYGEMIYVQKNGEIKQGEKGKPREYTELVRNSYVIRASITKTNQEERPVNRHVIHRRIKMLGEYFGLKDKLDTKYIQRSGMIYYASQLIGDEDEVTVNVLKQVAKRFNLQSHHNLKGFLTIENIRKTYPKAGGK